ncbi:Protein kinase domain [Leishmania braziliensis]|nr:Protein kinase domain [Leishmania braziliensis]
MTSPGVVWDGASLLLATDVAGVIHCYRYTTEKVCGDDTDDDDERVAVLTHLWSRSIGDEEVPSELVTGNGSSTYSLASLTTGTQQTVRDARAGFQCTLSKRLLRLQSASAMPALSVVPDPSGDHGGLSSGPPKKSRLTGGQSSTNDCNADIAYSTTAQGTREGGSNSNSPAAVAHYLRRQAIDAQCPFCTWASSLSSSPSAALASVCLSSTPELACASPVAVREKPTSAVVSAASPSCRIGTGDRAEMECRWSKGPEETDGGCCGSADNRENLFRPCDFMARIPEAAYSTFNASATAQPAVETGAIMSTDRNNPVVGCRSSPSAEVAWYWRCPRSVFDARTAPDGKSSDTKHTAHRHVVNENETSQLSSDKTEKETTKFGDDAAVEHLWMSLPEAVRHWNAICCHHHQLLLLRHMEERYSELDLFTGASLGSVALTADMAAATESAILDATSSSNNLEHSIFSSISDGSSTESSSDSVDGVFDATGDGVPRAVLSLKTQRYQTLIMQARVPRSPTKVAKKKTRKATMPASIRKTAHRCLAKLSAPVIQLGLTWHQLRHGVHKELPFSDADDEGVEEGHQGEAELVAVPQGEAAQSFPSSSSESTLHNSSTSTSDIDMDVLAGRKQLPPQYSFVRAVSPASSQSFISATSQSGAGNQPATRPRKTPAKQKRAEAGRSAMPSAGREAVLHDIPVRCGPGGCVYGGVAGTVGSITTTFASVETVPPQFLLLLQLPLPLVEAFWITLPSSSASQSSQNGSEAANLYRAGARSMFAVELRRVPWLPHDVCSLQAAEPAVDAPINAARPLTASLGDASASVGLTTLQGFVLDAQGVSSAPRAMSVGFPRILRTLSAYDICIAKSASVHRPRLVHDTMGNVKGLSASSDARERERSAKEETAPEYRNSPHAMPAGSSHTSLFYRSNKRSSSLSHSIRPPPSNYSPAINFFDENFEPLMLLGRGVSGAVLLVRHRFTGVFYAIKVLVARDYESECDILQELRVHAMLENRYVVRYHTCWSEVISPIRAQQLAFIGVCHPYEANMARRKRLNSASSSFSSTMPRRSARDGTWHPRANSDGCIPTRSQLRSAPGGWDHLRLPSHLSTILVGSTSTSESATPEVAQKRSRPQLRGSAWSATIMDELEDLTDEEGDETLLGQMEKWQGWASDRLGYSGPGMPSPTAIEPQPARHPLAVSSPSPAVRNTHALLASLRLRKKPPIASVLSSEPPFAASDSMGVTTVQEVYDGEEEEAESILDYTQGGDCSSSVSSGNSYGRPAPEKDSLQRQKGHTIIGTRVVFLQMELCQGTLAQYLASRASINRVENLIIAMQMVAGVRYLHHRGILHRDVKPTNVFLDYRCQYDKTVHQLNMSDTSSADGGSEDEGSAEASLGFSGSPASPCSAAAAGNGEGDNEACEPLSSSALTLCRRHPRVCSPELPSGGCSPSVSSAPRRSSIVPPGMQSLYPAVPSSLASDWNARMTMTSLSNLPSWDGERAVLDFVMHAPHRIASEMLQERLLRRPPPPAVCQRASSKCKMMEKEMGSSDAPMPLMAPNGGRNFRRRLANWLLHRFVQVRLGDFGLAKFLYQQELRVDGFVSMNAINTTGVGSPLYASPEQLQGSRCTPASDAFSVGVVLAEMYLQPKTVAERLTVLREVREGVYRDTTLLSRFPELKLVRRLTAAEPERRMTLAALHKDLKSFLEQALHEEVCRHYE